MKWIFIFLFPVLVSAQIYDTTYQMIYYQKSLIKKGKVELYGYTSYDLWWADESGIGLLYTLPNRRKKKTKRK
mgnify:CR=1 FL=1|jgi:hypothetical protein